MFSSRLNYGRQAAAFAILLGLTVCSAAAQEASPNRAQADLDRAMKLQLEAANISELEQALALCEKALNSGLSEEDQQLAHNLAASCLMQRANGIAAAIFDRQPPHPRWAQLREIALRDLDKAVKHVADLKEAHELVVRLSALPPGDPQRGLRSANELVRLAGDDKAEQAKAYVSRARFQEKPEDQLADLDRAAELDPESGDALQLRAALLVSQQRLDDAATTLRDLLKRDDTDAKTHLALGEVLANIEGKSDEALQEINRALELDPKFVAAYILRARLNTSKENLDAALSDLSEALKIDENEITALLFRAEIYLVKEDYKAARQDVDKLLEVKPGLVLGIMMRSRVSAAEEKYDDAIADMELLVQNDPQNVDLRLQLGAYYNAADRPRKAVKVLTELIDQDNANWRALRARGDALLAIGQHTEAVEDYNKALELNKEDSGLLNNLAWVLATSPEDGLRNGTRAIELAKKACELTEYKEAHILSTLASGYAETGDFKTAIEWSTKAVELGEGEMKTQLQKELESYQQSKPWREKQETAEKPEVPKRDLLET